MDKAYGKPIASMNFAKKMLKGNWKQFSDKENNLPGKHVMEVYNICHDCNCYSSPITSEGVKLENWQSEAKPRYGNDVVNGAWKWRNYEYLPQPFTETPSLQWQDGSIIFCSNVLPIQNHSGDTSRAMFYFDAGINRIAKTIYFSLTNGKDEMIRFGASKSGDDYRLTVNSENTGPYTFITHTFNVGENYSEIYIDVALGEEPIEIMIEFFAYGQSAILPNNFTSAIAYSASTLHVKNFDQLEGLNGNELPYKFEANKFYPHSISINGIVNPETHVGIRRRKFMDACSPARWNPCESEPGVYDMYLKYYIFEVSSYCEPDVLNDTGAFMDRYNFSNDTIRFYTSGILQHRFFRPPGINYNVAHIKFDQDIELKQGITYTSPFVTVANFDTIGGSRPYKTCQRTRTSYLVVTAEMDFGGECEQKLITEFPAWPYAAYWIRMFDTLRDSRVRIGDQLFLSKKGLPVTQPARNSWVYNYVNIWGNTVPPDADGISPYLWDHGYFPERYVEQQRGYGYMELHIAGNGTYYTMAPAVAVRYRYGIARDKADCNRVFQNVSDCQYIADRELNNYSGYDGGFYSTPVVRCTHPKLTEQGEYKLREGKCNATYCEFYTKSTPTEFEYGGDDSNSYL